MDEPRAPGSAARPRASASTRTRRPGSRNLKTDEWVSLHQHSILRTMERKETIFIIHGQKYRENDVRRKMRRAISSNKALLNDFKSLPPLPGHLELRTPSPEPTPTPLVDSARATSPTEQSSQRQERDFTDTVQQSSHASPVSEASSVDWEKRGDPLWTFLSQLPLSGFVLDFCIPSRTHSSRVIIDTSFGIVEARMEDSLIEFLDRLHESRNNNGDDILNYLALTQTLFSDHKNHFSFRHFLDTVVSALDETTNLDETLGGVFDEFWDLCTDSLTARAIGAAAYRNNFKAVIRLLECEEASIDSTVSRPHPYPDCDCVVSVMAYCQLPRFGDRQAGPSDEMVAYLLGLGAKAAGVEDGLLGLLDCLLRQRWVEPETFLAKVRSVVECITGFADGVCETGTLLETCVLQGGMNCLEQRLQAFELLLDRGAKATPGSPLAALIYMGGPLGLVEKALDRTTDINAYCNCNRPQGLYFLVQNDRFAPFHVINSLSPLQAAALRCQEELVDLLLDNRADVNCPARGSGGMTPLQGVCSPKDHVPLGPFESLEKQEKKGRIVKLLLDRGANVNAAPAWNLGLTALQAAAYGGDMELANFLVSRGANVNAPACKYGGGTALAMAARRNHVEMVRYLLAEGAEIPAAVPKVSSSPVAYDDNKIVMDLLRDQAPELVATYATRAAHSRDYREYEAEWAKDPTYVRKG